MSYTCISPGDLSESPHLQEKAGSPIEALAAPRNMLTIKETYQRAQSEGIGTSERFIRTSCANGTLPCVYCGRRALIYYPNYVRLVTGAEGGGAHESRDR